jgi:hypothetical protein
MRRVDGVFIIDVVRRFVNVMLTSTTLSVPEPLQKRQKPIDPLHQVLSFPVFRQ